MLHLSYSMIILLYYPVFDKYHKMFQFKCNSSPNNRILALILGTVKQSDIILLTLWITTIDNGNYLILYQCFLNLLI